MTEIQLPCYNMVVYLPGDGAGFMSSNLKKDMTNKTSIDKMTALESMIVSHARAGIDIDSPAYIEGIETAVEKCCEIEDLDWFDTANKRYTGERCPDCESTNIINNEVIVDNLEANRLSGARVIVGRKASCNDCEAVWVEILQASGFFNLETK